MIRNRRVEILLPEEWVLELDDVARSEKVNRSGLIREATRRYLLDRRREELRKQLRTGYVEMGSLNLELADELGVDLAHNGVNALEGE